MRRLRRFRRGRSFKQFVDSTQKTTYTLFVVRKRRQVYTLKNRKEEVRHVLTASEADELFGMQRGTTYKACKRGQFDTARQSGKVWLIHLDEALERWHDRLDGDLVWSDQQQQYYIQRKFD